MFKTARERIAALALGVVACGGQDPPRAELPDLVDDGCCLVDDVDSNSAADIAADASPADVIAVSDSGIACNGENLVCSPICHETGVCKSGKCAGASPYQTFELEFADLSQVRAPEVGRALPDGSILYAWWTSAGQSDSGPHQLQVGQILPSGVVGWQKTLEIASASEDFSFSVSPVGDRVAVLRRISADLLQVFHVTAAGKISSPVTLVAKEALWQQHFKACQSGYLILAPASNGPDSDTFVRVMSYKENGDFEWATKPITLAGQKEADVKSAFDWYCRPEGGAYFHFDIVMHAIDGTGAVFWSNESIHRILSVAAGEVVTASWEFVRQAKPVFTHWSATGEPVESHKSSIDVGTVVAAPGAQRGYMVLKVRDNLVEDWMSSPSNRVVMLLVRLGKGGDVEWVREFGPRTQPWGSAWGGQPRPVPGGGWDILTRIRPTPPDTAKRFRLLRVDSMGRLDCQVDKCTGITDLNHCDDSDPATFDWCKQTEGCVHEKD